MTDDLIAFLRAVHQEDERVAREAIDEQRRALTACGFSDDPAAWDDDTDGARLAVFAGNGGVTVADVLPGQAATANHVARHDPQSVLAQVEAERALVALYEHKAESMERYPNPVNIGGFGDLQRALRTLTWGHRHRDGWQESWRPDGAEATTDA